LRNRLYDVPLQFSSEPAVNAFIEQQLH
jgi:hypothetical protein